MNTINVDILLLRFKKIVNFKLSLLVLLSLSACSNMDYSDSTTVSNAQKKYIAGTMNYNLNSMTLLGAELNESISRLERIESYKKPRIVNVKDDNMKAHGLGARVFVDWTGPIEPLIEEVASYSNYKTKTIGMAPSIPVIVNVSSDDIELGDVIKTAHMQAKNRASVVIYPKSKTIEIRYTETG